MGWPPYSRAPHVDLPGLKIRGVPKGAKALSSAYCSLLVVSAGLACMLLRLLGLALHNDRALYGPRPWQNVALESSARRRAPAESSRFAKLLVEESTARGNGCSRTWWVFEVAKELAGVSSVGGAGAVVNSLVSGLSLHPCVHVTVLIPLYSSFNSSFAVPFYKMRASHLRYPSSKRPSDTLDNSTLDADEFVVHVLSRSHALFSDLPSDASARLSVLFMAPPSHQEFARVYDVPEPHALYETVGNIPAFVRDFIFASQVAEVISSVVGATADQFFYNALCNAWPGAAPTRSAFHVVQLHGAPTAMVAPLLFDFIPTMLHPILVYTLHDTEYEFLYDIPVGLDYALAVKTLQSRGDDVPERGTPTLSATELGFLYGDIITTVSSPLRTSLQSMSINNDESSLTGLICDALWGKRVHAISNAPHPRMNPATYPLPLLSSDFSTFRLGSVMATKRAAQVALAAAGLLPRIFVGNASGNQKPPLLVLFVGLFDGVKGFHLLPAAADALCASNAHLVVMGALPSSLRKLIRSTLASPDGSNITADYDDSARTLSPSQREILDIYETLRSAASNAHGTCSVTLVDTDEVQSKYGDLYRAAADVALVPSLSEAFGLTAVEGLLFGSLPVTSDADGLNTIVSSHPDFLPGLRSIRTSGNSSFWNGVKFRVNTPQMAVANLVDALKFSIRLLQNMTPYERELHASSFAFSQIAWGSEGGPTELYLAAYTDAVGRREDTVARVMIRMVGGSDNSCREALLRSLDWGSNLLRTHLNATCSSTTESLFEPLGQAGFDLLRLTYPFHAHISDKVATAYSAVAANADVHNPRTVVVISTSAARISGGAAQLVAGEDETWEPYWAQMRPILRRLRERVSTRLGEIAVKQREYVAYAGLQLEHNALGFIPRPDILLVISAWSAPMDLLVPLAGADQQYLMRVEINGGCTQAPRASAETPFPVETEVGKWTQRTIVFHCDLPFRALQVSVLFAGYEGSVAFDALTANVYIGSGDRRAQ